MASVCALTARCGLKGISLHSFRHTHSSQLLSAGVPLPTVSKRPGHSSVNVTATAFAADEVKAAQAWDTQVGGAVDQGRQTGHALDKAVVPSVPGERGTATTERAGLQPGQLVAAARTAERDQELIADKLAAPVDEDGRQIGQARAVLLVALGRGPSQSQAVRRYAGAGLGAACARRVTPTARTASVQAGCRRWRGRGVARKPSAVAGTARSGRFEGWSRSERSIKRGSSAKTVAARPWMGYPIRGRTATKEIPVKIPRESFCSDASGAISPKCMRRRPPWR